MSDIKNVLAILCNNLNLLLDVNLKPEHFRLAKFNKNDNNVIDIFWNVLSKFINNFENNLVNNVKFYLLNINYNCLQFYSLPEDKSYGSRELLIALSFIISRDILNEIITKEIKNSPFNPNFDITTCNNSCYKKNFDINFELLKNDEDFKNAIQWIDGRIKYNDKHIKEYKACIQKLIEKIQEKCDNLPRINDLSRSEIIALNSEQCCMLFLEKSSRIMKILENHEKWLRKEHVFWNWMSTVLLEREKDKQPPSPSNLESFFCNLQID